jgi:branched-chain amino acid transport system permease protein
MKRGNRRKIGLYIGIAAALIVLVALYFVTGKQAFIRTALSGLTLGSLFFLVAAGLTLIFGLMDVLNFAHGAMFMLGAYIGWQFYTNPTFIFGMLPAVLSLAFGILLIPLIKPYLITLNLSEKVQKNLPKLLYILAGLAALVAFWQFNILSLAKTAMVAATVTNASNPLAEISLQEPMARFWIRPVMLVISGLLLAIAVSKPGDKSEFAPKEKLGKNLIMPIALLVLLIVSILVREQAPVTVLLMNGNLRFVLAIVAAVLFGILFGTIIEVTMIRPLYVRPFFIVLMTLGLSFVIRELVQLLWDPLAYQMSRPPLFATVGKAATSVGAMVRLLSIFRG